MPPSVPPPPHSSVAPHLPYDLLHRIATDAVGDAVEPAERTVAQAVSLVCRDLRDVGQGFLWSTFTLPRRDVHLELEGQSGQRLTSMIRRLRWAEKEWVYIDDEGWENPQADVDTTAAFAVFVALVARLDSLVGVDAIGLSRQDLLRTFTTLYSSPSRPHITSLGLGVIPLSLAHLSVDSTADDPILPGHRYHTFLQGVRPECLVSVMVARRQGRDGFIRWIGNSTLSRLESLTVISTLPPIASFLPLLTHTILQLPALRHLHLLDNDYIGSPEHAVLRTFLGALPSSLQTLDLSFEVSVREMEDHLKARPASSLWRVRCITGPGRWVFKRKEEGWEEGDDFPLDHFLPSKSSPPPVDSPSSDKQHLHDAVDALDALDHLESDIGSISLSSPPLAPPSSEPSRARSLSVASAAASSVKPPSIEEEDDGRNIGLHSVADCVLRLLESLEEPVVTYELYQRAVSAEKRDEAFGVVQALPEAHANTLLYIIAFLRVLLQQTAEPLERAARLDRLAVVFSTVLLRPPPSAATGDKLDPATIPRRKKAFVIMLLQEEETRVAV
ncbi:hypothetical protein JCM6882_006461 [Rhodosporidiobolus microsporus]